MAQQSALSCVAVMKPAAMKLEVTASILALVGQRFRQSITTALVASCPTLTFVLRKVSGFY